MTEHLFHRAVQAYFRRYGRDAQQPGWKESSVYMMMPGCQRTAVIVLRNVNGRLATYRYYHADDRLRFVENQVA